MTISIWTWVKTVFLLGIAAGLLSLSVWLALLDRVPAATLMAGLFIVVVLFHYLPQMESFKAYGVEAKWRARLNEADEILRKLRQSTLASASLSYMTLGWGSRMGGAKLKEKQAVADQIDQSLVDLGVSDSQIYALKQGYIFFSKYDLFQTFDSIVQMKIEKNLRPILKGLDSLNHEETNPEVVKLTRLRVKLEEKRRPIDLLTELTKADFRTFCHDRVPNAAIEDGDRVVLEKFADTVSDIAERCASTGRVTDQAAELIEKYSIENRKVLYKNLFGEDPPA
jgi:hypothetical protein